jgi:hypothetical protein
MKRSSVVLALLGALAPGLVAHADRLTVARAQPLVEVSHSVDVEIAQGVARYKVRRTFANNGTRADEASLRIELAHGAAVTGLRIRARDRWYDGDLMDAEEAREKYRELTGIGAWQVKDPALLQWVWADQVHLQVFPVSPGAVSTVEYTLTAPLEYREGRYVLSYPGFDPSRSSDSLPLAEPVLRVRPGHGDARTEIRVAGQRVAPDAPIVLMSPAPLAWIGEGEPDPGAGHVFSRLDVDRDEPVTAAKIKLEIDHTYSGDLRVELVTPGGQHLPVTRGSSDSNDIRGSFDVTLPPGSRSAGAWHLAVSDNAGLDVGTLDAWSMTLSPDRAGAAAIHAAGADLPRFIPDAPDSDGSGGHVLIEIEPPKIRTLDVRLGRVVASAEHGFSRLELDAAPRLGELPREASVVFVLDVSRSVEPELLAAQLRVVAAYLSHVRDAHVELVVFDRQARRVFGDFVTSGAFPGALDDARSHGKLGFGNGSALEQGLALAARTLADRRGPTRIVALTDARLRSSFVPGVAARELASGARSVITHVVIPEEGEVAELRRDDTHVLAGIAAAQRGVLFTAVVPEADKALPTQMLGLVRPVAIDDFKVGGIDLSGAAEVPASLREGVGYRAMIASAEPTRRVVVSGKIWARRLHRVVEHGEVFDDATAAFVFSEDEHHGLSDEEMRTVAFKGRAVSPVTSYLAIEPGVRPSIEGLLELEAGSGFGVGGLGLMGTGRGGGGASIPLPQLSELLDASVAACAKLHAAGSGWAVSLKVETTGPEIVDVAVTRGSHAPLRECVVAAAWALELPSAAWPERESHDLHFVGAAP